MIKLAIFTAFVIMLSGCAVMDTTVMDTAEPLKPGHVKLEPSISTGLILESAVRDPNDDTKPDQAVMWPLMGLKLGLGLQDQTEIGAKGWFTLGTTGLKTYIKKQYDQKDNVYYAVIPAFTYTGVDNDDAANDDGYNPDSDHKYTSVGLELPFLITKKYSENISLTAALRMNYNYFKYQYVEEHGGTVKRGPYNVFHAGILGNARFKHAFLILTPELGVEFIPVVNGNVNVMPDAGITLGLQF